MATSPMAERRITRMCFGNFGMTLMRFLPEQEFIIFDL